MTMKDMGKEKVDTLDLDDLLHPAHAFAHPTDVVRDPDLTLGEKRAILASWASDAWTPEQASAQRVNKSGIVVRWDDIMDALRALDEIAKPLPHYKRVLAKKDAGLLRKRRLRPRNRNDEGASLN